MEAEEGKEVSDMMGNDGEEATGASSEKKKLPDEMVRGSQTGESAQKAHQGAIPGSSVASDDVGWTR